MRPAAAAAAVTDGARPRSEAKLQGAEARRALHRGLKTWAATQPPAGDSAGNDVLSRLAFGIPDPRGH